MNEEQRKRMADKSGASNQAPKYTVPFIQFDGRAGTFSKVSYKNNEKEEMTLKSPVEFVILKKRRTLSSFKPSYFSTEHNKTNDKIMLFKKMVSNGKSSISFEAVGYANELREQNPLLKTHEIVYVLHEGEVCKMEIKSGSIMDYYAFQKSYGDEELHGFEITTKVSSISAENDSGSYKKMVFSFVPTLPEGVTFDEIESKMDEVTSNLAKVDAYTLSRIDEKLGGNSGGKSSGLTTEQASSIKEARDAEINARNKADEAFNNVGKDINPDDIPF
jgi:hypothetical protein